MELIRQFLTYIGLSVQNSPTHKGFMDLPKEIHEKIITEDPVIFSTMIQVNHHFKHFDTQQVWRNFSKRYFHKMPTAPAGTSPKSFFIATYHTIAHPLHEHNLACFADHKAPFVYTAAHFFSAANGTVSSEIDPDHMRLSLKTIKKKRLSNFLQLERIQQQCTRPYALSQEQLQTLYALQSAYGYPIPKTLLIRPDLIHQKTLFLSRQKCLSQVPSTFQIPEFKEDHNTHLVIAAAYGLIEEVKRALQEEVKRALQNEETIHQSYKNGAFLLACTHYHAAIIPLLFEHATFHAQENALHHACAAQNIPLIQFFADNLQLTETQEKWAHLFMLKKQHPLNKKRRRTLSDFLSNHVWEPTLLPVIIQTGHLSILRYAFECIGASSHLSCRDYYHQLLCTAIRYGHTDCLDYLLQQQPQAPIDTLLCTAIETYQKPTLLYLLDKQAFTLNTLKEALAMAIARDLPEITQLLLQKMQAVPLLEIAQILLNSLDLQGPHPYDTLKKPTKSLFFVFQNKNVLEQALHLEQQQEHPDPELLHYVYKQIRK